MVIYVARCQFTQPRVGSKQVTSSAFDWVIARKSLCKRRSIWERTGIRISQLRTGKEGIYHRPSLADPPGAEIFPRVLTKVKSLLAFRPDQLSVLVSEQ